MSTFLFAQTALFQSTPSVRRATVPKIIASKLAAFQSTPSVRRATAATLLQLAAEGTISIHALREEGDSETVGRL